MPENAVTEFYDGVYMNNTRAGRRSATERRFYLIEPRQNVNASELAGKLIGLKTVEEVFLSDGAYGFIVKVRLLKGRAADEVVKYIRKRVAARFGTANTHYRYSK